jgi:hypothetical protein
MRFLRLFIHCSCVRSFVLRAKIVDCTVPGSPSGVGVAVHNVHHTDIHTYNIHTYILYYCIFLEANLGSK